MNETDDANIGAPKRRRALKLISFEDLVDATDADGAHGWLWDGVVPATGTVLLHGPAFSFKTTLLAGLAAAMSRTDARLADRTVRKGLAILALLEHRSSGVRDLIVDAAKGAGVQEVEAVFLRELDLDKGEQVSELAERADRLNASLVVIDAVRRASRFDENSAADVAELGRIAASLTGGGKRVVILVHHDGRSGEPRGSTDFRAQADTVVRVRHTRGMLTLTATHHDAPEVVLSMNVIRDEDGLRFEVAEGKHVDSSEDAAHRAAILKLIEAGPRTMRGVRDGLRSNNVSLGNASIDRLIEGLALEGVIENRGTKNKGKWVVTSP